MDHIDRVKEYNKNVVDQKSASAKTINLALDVVRQYIIDNNLILVGGMMIDLALKLKGDAIYSPSVLPDYDFYSPNHYNDAYRLGELLCKKDFKHISVIPARHTTTMKVRIDFENVADITFCPPVLFEKVPTLRFGKFLIRHPHVQFIDQHLALSKPFVNPGQSVIFERWKKDAERYDILYKHYPISQPSKDELPPSSAFHTVTLPRDMIKGNCLAGWAAFDVWKSCIGLDNVKTVTIPKWAPISLLTNNISQFDKYTPQQKYNQYFDQLPTRITFEHGGHKWEVFDTSDIKVGAHEFQSGWVCNLQYVMVYLLTHHVYKFADYHNDNVEIYARSCYITCRELIIDSYSLSPDVGMHYRPTVELYGKEETSSALEIYKKKFMAQFVNKTQPEKSAPPSGYPKYPTCMITADFDTTKSKYFDIDGLLITDQDTESNTSTIV
jgi:hypothetical protein